MTCGVPALLQSPTTRLVPPHYFTPTADGNNNHSSPADGMQHASYTTAGTLHPPAFGSVVLPAGDGGAGEVSTVYEGGCVLRPPA